MVKVFPTNQEKSFILEHFRAGKIKKKFKDMKVFPNNQ